MISPAFDTVHVGDTLPELQLAPLKRSTLALFAGASGDHNPIHIDLDFAQGAGQPDVFAHGMLGMAWLARLLTQWASQAQLRQLDVRFQDTTHIGDAIRCGAQVLEKQESGGERLVRLQLHSTNQHGQVKIVGQALVALP